MVDYFSGGNLYHQLKLRAMRSEKAKAVAAAASGSGSGSGASESSGSKIVNGMAILDEEECVYIIAQLVHALDYLHCECGVIYRGLKLDHILIDEDGYIGLTDFKNSKFIGRKKRKAKVTESRKTSVTSTLSVRSGIGVKSLFAGLSPISSYVLCFSLSLLHFVYVRTHTQKR